MRLVMSCLLLPVLVACAQKPAAEADVQSVATGCLPAGDGRLEAQLRGAFVADIYWDNAQMQCDGGPRPDGAGLRVTIAGTQGERQLRFIFGIDLVDTASGPAQALPTNLTVIVEGEARLYATRGDDKCAVENLERVGLAAGQERVTARGYCLGPAADMAGGAPLLVPTFSFTALARSELADGPITMQAQPVSTR
jgi:hypothetical protein